MGEQARQKGICFTLTVAGVLQIVQHQSPRLDQFQTLNPKLLNPKLDQLRPNIRAKRQHAPRNITALLTGEDEGNFLQPPGFRLQGLNEWKQSFRWLPEKMCCSSPKLPVIQMPLLSVKGRCKIRSLNGAFPNYHFGGPLIKDYSILGSILGSPDLRKLPNEWGDPGD